MVADPELASLTQGDHKGGARPCFLWSTARSGTNIVTAALSKLPDVSTFNEDDPRAFETFLLRDDTTIQSIVAGATTPVVFFKSFGDTPRAPHLMSLFPDARAIYLLREPVDVIASFVQEFGEMTQEAWCTVFRSHREGKPIHSFRHGGADTQKLSETREMSSQMLSLLDTYGITSHNVAAALYLWQHSFLLRYGAGPAGRVLLVKYSDFTQSPEGVFTHMCRWFGAQPNFDQFPRLHSGRGSRSEQGAAHPELIRRCEEVYRQISTSDRLSHIPTQALATSAPSQVPDQKNTVPAASTHQANSNMSFQHYAELLKRAVTGYLYLDWDHTGHGLQYGSIDSLDPRKMPIAELEKRRQEGLDWPGLALSMCGFKRLDNLAYCLKQVVEEGVEGDFIETGVWRGGASIFATGILRYLGQRDRITWVADSFKGLPPPEKGQQPADANCQFHQHEYLAVSRERVQRSFELFGLMDENVRFIEGYFEDTLKTAPVDKLCIARLDGDMYSSTMCALEALYPKVSKGGYLIIDDYGLEQCSSAVTDFRKAHGIQDPMHKIDWTGMFWKVSG